MLRYPVVLFDLDGTVIDTNHLILTTFQHIFREHLQLEVPAEAIYPFFGEPLPRTLGRWAPDRAEELSDLYRAYNNSRHDELTRQFPGMPQALSTLHQAGVRMAIVTSKRSGTARRGLRVTGLEGYFEVLVGMDETERHKPDPEPALLALARLGVSPGPQVLMVGDSRFDIGCGRNAGLTTAGVSWTVNQAALQESGPDLWLESPAELVRVVLGQAAACGG